jgi:hypothetical protein
MQQGQSSYLGCPDPHDGASAFSNVVNGLISKVLAVFLVEFEEAGKKCKYC